MLLCSVLFCAPFESRDRHICVIYTSVWCDLHIRVIYTSVWFTHPCDLHICVIYTSVWCDLHICVIYTSVWFTHPCDLHIRVIYTSVWFTHLCDLHICVIYTSVWFTHLCDLAIIIWRSVVKQSWQQWRWWWRLCLLRRCTRLRPKVKRQRYTLLEDMDDSDRISTGKLDLLPAGKHLVFDAADNS